ncbi:MAG: hypothetical protein KDC80_20600 [Saprospiraceae bacterium]|nr:hypothetical protein [Saprospiraceae bacterium]
MKKPLYLVLLTCLTVHLLAQDEGLLSGQLMLNGNVFLEDQAIGASNTPQYDHQIFGSEVWLDLNYQYKGFDLGIRMDIFNNSNLLNPRDSYSGQGVGKWYIRKQIDALSIQVGYIYDQIGSGLIFRSYEERPLLIDNGLYGASLQYSVSDNLSIKAFGGKQKNLFNTYDSFLKGAAIDGYIALGKDQKISLVPGFGFVNKTFSDDQINDIIGTVRNYTPVDSIGLYYNSYAFSVYNTLSAGPVVWYIEGAYKSNDVYFDPEGRRQLFNGETTLGKFRNDPGSVLYSSLSLGLNGLGVTVEYKRTENFSFRADPFAALNRGLVNYLPPMAKINSYRLKSRYTPATQDLAEQAFQAEVRYAISKQFKVVHYLSNITDLAGKQLYREFDTEVTLRKSSANQLTLGLQRQQYNQEVYEGKAGVPLVETWTPYLEWFHRFTRRKSIKIESQFMSTGQDFGSWLFFLAEYNVAPRWSFAISDMYNVEPVKSEDLHYPRLDIVYVKNANRFSLSFIKQVEGVVCAGGICRLEPAFSGVRFTLNSTF